MRVFLVTSAGERMTSLADARLHEAEDLEGRGAPGAQSRTGDSDLLWASSAAERVADAIAEGCGKNSDFELARFGE